MKKIGELLYEAGYLTRNQLDMGLEEQLKTQKRLGEILVEKGIITEEILLGALEFQLGIPYMNLEQYNVDMNQAAILPEHIARRYIASVVGIEAGKLIVAMKNPMDMIARDDIERSTKCEMLPRIASEKSICKLMNQTYVSTQTNNIMGQVERQLQAEQKQVVYEEEGIEDTEDKPVIQFVNNILQRCILKHASDVHIEPFEKDIRIRYRIDGQLYVLARPPKELLGRLTTRLKILSGLNIAEKRLPQDGRISKRIADQQVDMRISILPTIYGEKTVIRFMYKTGEEIDLEHIGFYPSDYQKVMNMLKSPHGIILLTGPTGSGKSTTLAALLKVLNRDYVNIITVEDPVENRIEGINQVATHSKIGLTFANVLRSILRQDPDIIMIGEMRDSETSTIAMRAAITGHLVLSTLHTNDAVSSIPRLMDMGSEPYMVGAAIKGVISQRLVRCLCQACRKPHIVTKQEASLYKIPVGTKIYEAKGCASCNHTGYKGRMAVHEVLEVDNELQEVIATGRQSNETIKEKAIKKGMRTLWDNGIESVLSGQTTMTEIFKITYEQ
ncbi:MAG: Flp pilus assembly complex ATPase component TadA [Cellulosilyticum sp.]|nr:Flp pilus assembly complex ATPase component TadA [Cellulosilyticum sp.]